MGLELGIVRGGAFFVSISNRHLEIFVHLGLVTTKGLLALHSITYGLETLFVVDGCVRAGASGTPSVGLGFAQRRFVSN